MTGIILAGGKSSRFGENKALIEVAGRPIIERTIEVLGKVFNEIIIVSNRPEDYDHLGARVVEDIIPGKGPLSGIHSGLVNSSSFYNFVVACDMPFLKVEHVRLLKERAIDCDVLVPTVQGKMEPLHAVYSKACLVPLEERLRSSELSVIDFIKSVQAKVVEFNDSMSFVNINTRKDWECCLTALAER